MIAAFVLQFILHFIDEEKKFHTVLFSLCGLAAAFAYNISLVRKGREHEYRFRDYFYSVGLSVAGRYIGTFIIVAVSGLFGITLLK